VLESLSTIRGVTPGEILISSRCERGGRCGNKDGCLPSRGANRSRSRVKRQMERHQPQKESEYYLTNKLMRSDEETLRRRRRRATDPYEMKRFWSRSVSARPKLSTEALERRMERHRESRRLRSMSPIGVVPKPPVVRTIVDGCCRFALLGLEQSRSRAEPKIVAAEKVSQ